MFEIYCGDVIEQLRQLPNQYVNTCVTSPPYYGLRDYGTGTWVGGNPDCPHYRTSKRSDITITGHKAMAETGHPMGDAIYKTVCPACGAVRVDNQIGLEETPEEYINKLVEVFREVRRVLRDDGILWVNIGDSYAGSGKGRKSDGELASLEKSKITTSKSGGAQGNLNKTQGAKPKDLVGIPWMLAFALRADGWYLRQDIIWAKNNPMPESVKDRCTRSHEYIFMLTKNKKYWFDHEAMQEDAVSKSGIGAKFGGYKYGDSNDPKYQCYSGNKYKPNGKRNKRDVWNCSVAITKDAHFAVFPKDLIEPCILSSCPEDGIVLDPFSGSGTTGIVATQHNRNYVGIELNPEYIEITKRRVEKECTNVFIAVRNQ